MQLVALNKNLVPVHADNAQSKENYVCLGCKGPLRVRLKGRSRAHFFHLHKRSLCAQNKKTALHLETQKYIVNALPHGEGALEVRFSSIDRIADVVWEKKKIVFEVQRSSITKKEVEMRNIDYAKLGYQAVWILHEKKFGKRDLSSMELFLFSATHYFSSVDEQGKGCIYDQLCIIEGSKAVFRGAKLPITLKNPFSFALFPQNMLKSLPQILARRQMERKLGFQGDLFDLGKDNSDSIQRLEKFFSRRKKGCFAKIFKKILTDFLHLLIRKNAGLYKK